MTYRLRLGIGFLLVISLGGGLLVVRDRGQVPDRWGEVAAAEAAMTAWARFAGTGDLSTVSGHFAVDGPQYRQLSTEALAGVVRGGEPYRFVIHDPVVMQPGLIRGSVIVSRPGEPDQRFRWDIELRLVDGRWQVWTVRTANPGF